VISLFRRLAPLVAAGTLLSPALAHAAGVRAEQPFPSNLQTVRDASQPTGLRVSLPLPDCTTYPSDCQDVAVLNSLDGFNLQPRIDVPFSGPIDLSTVSSSTIRLYDTSCLVCAPIGIDQVVWEPAANTLHFESARFLKESTTYLLVVTDGVRDTSGQPVRTMRFGGGGGAYTKELSLALRAGARFLHVAAASVFTTQSATLQLRQIRAQLDATATAPATIEASFPAASVTSIVFNRQTGTSTFTPALVPTPFLNAIPGSVGQIVFGSYVSPQYENAARVITASPTPTPETIQFNLFLPSSPEPAGGYPVAVFGHGFGDNKNSSPFLVASSMAAHGIATIAINVVGHGGGAAGTLAVTTPSGTTVLPAGGRGIDQNGDGAIASTEGVAAVAPFALVSNRDGLRQTVIDDMELVRVIHGGGIPHLSTSRIYYFGQSFGGIYGTELLGTDPLIRAGVPNVPGGPIIEIARLAPVFRPLVGIGLATRVPSLYNAVPNATFTNFVENEPLRGQPIVVDTVPGASAIQQFLDRSEWAQQAGDPAAYAPRITRPVIVQFAKGDQTVPNPTASALIRAGGLESRATYFRNDLARAADPTFPKNPHTFLTNLLSGPGPAAVALAAQNQIATFFGSDGATTIDPDGPGPLFETPIAGPLPETLNFIP
jgi:hypothetical protein